MGRTHYFQRYSQKENVLTNNTLLLLQHFYKHDYKRFNDFLNNLFDDQVDITIGPAFEQQIKGEGSIPDGHINQKSFSIIIEAKPNQNDVSISQILDHLNAFNQEETKVLLTISKEELDSQKFKKIKEQIDQSTKNDEDLIHFTSLTYADIIDELNTQLEDHEMAIQEIVDDYELMCQKSGVISSKDYTMLAVSCGKSIKENAKYDIYYNPVERSHNKEFRFLGIYNNKAIRYVGEIDTKVGCDLVDGQLEPTMYEEKFQELTDEKKGRIKGIIEDTAKSDYYTSIAKGKEFYLVKKFHRVNFKKASKGGLRKKKYMNLENYGYEGDMNGEEVAEMLDGKEWE